MWNSELLESTCEKRTSQVSEAGEAVSGLPHVTAAGVSKSSAKPDRASLIRAAPTCDPLRTPDRLAGVDEERGTRHEARFVVRRQEDHCPYQVAGSADLPEGDPR